MTASRPPLPLLARIKKGLEAGAPNVYKRWEASGFQDNTTFDARRRRPIRRRLDIYRGSNRAPWILVVLQRMASSRQLAVALTPFTEIVIANNSTPFHGYRGMNEISSAAFAAVQGQSTKSIQQGALSANIFTATSGAAADGFAVFGWRLRLSASPLNFDARPHLVTIGPIASAAGVLSIPTPVIQFQIIPRRNPVDLAFFSVQNAAGLGTITPGRSGNVVADGTTSAFNGMMVSLSTANYFATIESLNSRDLLSRAPLGVKDEAVDAEFDHELAQDTEVFEGIRDAAYDELD